MRRRKVDEATESEKGAEWTTVGADDGRQEPFRNEADERGDDDAIAAEQQLEAALRAATAAASAADTDGQPHTAMQGRSRTRVFTYLLLSLFFLLLMLTWNGIAPPVSSSTSSFSLSLPAIRRFINQAKIRVQTWAGLRQLRTQKNVDKRATKGHGGATNINKRANDEQGDQEGPSPPSQLPFGSIDDDDDDAPLLDIHSPVDRDPRALYLTLEQLSEFNGSDASPIYLAIYGRIFDVSSGSHFYAPGRGYSYLAGKDVSRAFATNCYNNQQLYDIRGLTKKQRRTIDRWYEFYNNHHTYQAIGWVLLPGLPPDAPLPNDTC